MSTTSVNSPRLSMPYIQSAQAQKHVTLNENLRKLDVLVQSTVISTTQNTPPIAPSEGDAYIIAGIATGDWVGREAQIAAYQDGAWVYTVPNHGWRTFDKTSATLLVFDNSGWTAVVGGGLSLTELSDGTLTTLGVNTAADAYNRLAVKTTGGFISHDDVSGSGTGDVRIDYNKLASTNTAAFLFKTNWTAHAEIGLAGDNKLRAKVSPDGTNWFTAFEVNETSGEVSFPNTSFSAALDWTSLSDTPSAYTGRAGHIPAVDQAEAGLALVKTNNIAAFGAVGDGVTDDTPALKAAFDAGVNSVDLNGLPCAINTDVEDPISGVKLTRDVKGEMIIGGQTRHFDAALGRALAVTEALKLKANNSKDTLGLYKKSDLEYSVYMPKASGIYERAVLKRAAASLPFNMVERALIETREEAYTGAAENSVYTGSWGPLSGLTYIGGRAAQAYVPTACVMVTIEGPGDIYVVFTGRTQGNFVNVTLNGTTDYIILPDDGAGNKYFDSYTATDLSHYQIVKVAADVPYGTHQLELTVSADRNPAASAGTRYLHNTVYIKGPSVEPWNYTPPRAKDWQVGEAILRYEERYSNGITYYATVDGTTGATAPTHAFGTASDGGVNWAVRTVNRYISRLSETYFQREGAQMETIASVKANGTSDFETYGGGAYGNEELVLASWYNGLNSIELNDAQWFTANSLSLVESLVFTDAETGDGTTPIINTQLQYDFTSNGFSLSFEKTVNVDLEIGEMNIFMTPWLAYDAANQEDIINSVSLPSAPALTLADFYGTTPTRAHETRDLLVIAAGDCFGGDYGLQLGLQISSDALDHYRSEGSKIYVAPNLTGVDPVASPNASVTMNVYPTRHTADAVKHYSAGDVLSGSAFYSASVHIKG